MSECAGSSTDGLAVAPLVFPGKVRSARAGFFKYFTGQVQMDRAPGRIGFMSTQRRESRWRHIDCSDCAEVLGRSIPDPQTGRVRANASGGTAPPIFSASFHPSDEDLSLGAPARLATNSLQLGFGIVRLVQFVQLVCLVQIVQLVQLVEFVQFVRSGLRFCSPPYGAGVGAAFGRPANHGSSLQHTPSPPGFSRLPLTLPWVPAG